MICFRFRETVIEVKFLFVAMITVFLLIDRSGMAVLGVLAALIHELGHIIAFMATGYAPQKLSFELCGIRLQKKTYDMSYAKELLVLLAGSGTNFLIFILFCRNLDTVTPLNTFAVIHLILGVINLLPITGLDGGRIVEIITCYLFGERVSEVTAVILKWLILCGVFATCCYMTITHAANFSIWVLFLYLLSVCVIPTRRETVA